MKKLIRKLISPELIHKGHTLQAIAAAAQHGFPAKKLRIIGITGTNGKTSTCHYITQILEEAGYKVGMLTTVAISINGKRELNKSKMTTVDANVLQSQLKKMVDAGCEFAV